MQSIGRKDHATREHPQSIRFSDKASTLHGLRTSPKHSCFIDLLLCVATHPAPQAHDWIRQAKKESPSRRVNRSGKHGSFRYPSHKMGFAVDCEGAIERHFAVEAEHDSRVASYYPQPPPISLYYARGDGKNIRTSYTPDFLVDFSDGKCVVVECKPLDRISALILDRDPRASFDPKTASYSDPVASREFQKMGMSHAMVLDIDANSILLRNLDFLGRTYLRGNPCSATVTQLVEAVARRGAVALNELLEPTNTWTSSDVYIAIAMKKLHCDLTVDRLDAGCATVFADSMMLREYRAAPVCYGPPPRASEGKKALQIGYKKMARLMPVLEGSLPASSLTRRERILLARSRNAHARGESILDIATPKYSKRGNHTPRISAAHEEFINSSIRNNLSLKPRADAAYCYGAYLNSCKTNAFVAVSITSFRLRLKAIRESPEAILAAHGRAIAYQKMPASILPPTTAAMRSTRPWQIAGADHTPVSVVVLVSGAGRISFPAWASILVDEHVGAHLGIYVSFTRPRWETIRALLVDCFQRWGRLPDAIKLDGEKAHDSISVETVLAQTGTEKIGTRYRSPRSNSAVESSHSKIGQGLLKFLAGSTVGRPSLTLQDPILDPHHHATLTLGGLYQRTCAYSAYCNDKPSLNISSYSRELSMRAEATRTLEISAAKYTLYDLLPRTRSRGPTNLGQRNTFRVLGQTFVSDICLTRSQRQKIVIAYNPYDLRWAYGLLPGTRLTFPHQRLHTFEGLEANKIRALSTDWFGRARALEMLRKPDAQSRAELMEQMDSLPEDPGIAYAPDSTMSIPVESQPSNDDDPWSALLAPGYAE